MEIDLRLDGLTQQLFLVLGEPEQLLFLFVEKIYYLSAAAYACGIFRRFFGKLRLFGIKHRIVSDKYFRRRIVWSSCRDSKNIVYAGIFSAAECFRRSELSAAVDIAHNEILSFDIPVGGDVGILAELRIHLSVTHNMGIDYAALDGDIPSRLKRCAVDISVNGDAFCGGYLIILADLTLDGNISDKINISDRRINIAVDSDSG